MRLFRTVFVYLLPVLLISGTGSVAPSRFESGTSAAISTKIDHSYSKIWNEKRIAPAPVCSDEEFLRRAYLDITGRIPTASQAESFLQSKDSKKREKLLSQLVNSPECAEYFASLWTALFLGYRNDPYVDRIEFQKWMQSKLQAGLGWDRIANEMIVATGNLVDSPALNWYGRHKMDAANLADDTSRLFLGIQLGCARCHDHPHEKWKLEDFYGIAAFYGGLSKADLGRMERMQRRELKRQREEVMAKYKTGEKALRKDPETMKHLRNEFRELVRLAEEPASKIGVEIQGKQKVYPARFLLQPEPAHITTNQRQQLAAWITSPENPFFAQAFVNRIWGLLMGKGFVHPVDDLGGSNQPSNPELLAELASDFKNHQYDFRRLVFSIANTKVYQLSSRSTMQEKPAHYERGKVQMLNPDQLVNSFLTATSVEHALRLTSNREFEDRKEMMYLHHVFLFDNDDTKPSVEFEGTISQALFLLNGRITNESIQPLPENTTTKVINLRTLNPAQKVDQLFLHVLSRHATQQEVAHFQGYVLAKADKTSAYEDILWALLNSDEFLFNH